MYRYLPFHLALLVACGGGSGDGVESSDAGGGDANTPMVDAGIDAAFAESHHLGVDISTAQGESFGEAFDFASTSGMNFITLPVNWNSIESGPNDDFSYASLNAKKWRGVVATGTLAIVTEGGPVDGELVWSETGSGEEAAQLYTAYTLSSQDLSVAVTATLDSVDLDGTEITLLTRFSTDISDVSGNTCATATDRFVAIVLLTAGSSPSVALATCTAGVFAVPTIVAAPANTLNLRLRRTATEVVAEYRTLDTQVYTTLGTVLASDFGDAARPHLYFGNPNSGTVTITADDFVVQGSATWDDNNDRYSADPAFDILGIVELVYSTLPVRIALSLRTINTVTAELPSDLRATSQTTGLIDFNTPEMKARFKDFIDHVFSRIPNVDLLSISLGNEIDVYLGSSATAWSQYAAFISDVAPHARLSYGAPIVVGAKTTLEGVVLRSAEVAAVNANTDAVMLTYYPLQGDFSVNDPSVVASDLDEVISAMASEGLGDKDIFILEAGYPSASVSVTCPACNSSEQKQEDFVRNLFAAWQDRGDTIAAINFNWLTDVGQSTLDEWRDYYGINDETFIQFLGTLGYRNLDGSAKQGWTAIEQEALSLGWEPRTTAP